MATHYRITSAVTDDTQQTITAKCCEQTGTRKDKYNKSISIMQCRNVTVVILIADLPKTGELAYIKAQIETAYAALPDETLVKSLIGKMWTGRACKWILER